MAQARKVKAVKAWATFNDSGELYTGCIAPTKAFAECWWGKRRIVRVLITPITPRNRKAKK